MRAQSVFGESPLSQRERGPQARTFVRRFPDLHAVIPHVFFVGQAFLASGATAISGLEGCGSGCFSFLTTLGTESPGIALDRLAAYGYLTRPHQPEFQDSISNSAFFDVRPVKKRRHRTDESHKESSVENDNTRTCRLDRAGTGSFGENRGSGAHEWHVGNVAGGCGLGTIEPGGQSDGGSRVSNPPISSAARGKPWRRRTSSRPNR